MSDIETMRANLASLEETVTRICPVCDGAGAPVRGCQTCGGHGMFDVPRWHLSEMNTRTYWKLRAQIAEAKVAEQDALLARLNQDCELLAIGREAERGEILEMLRDPFSEIYSANAVVRISAAMELIRQRGNTVSLPDVSYANYRQYEDALQKILAIQPGSYRDVVECLLSAQRIARQAMEATR